MYEFCGETNVIYRGSTPTIYFITDLDMTTSETWQGIDITFAQQGKVLFTKQQSDVTLNVEEKIMSVDLTQQETLLFKDNINLQVQIKIKLNDGKVVPSEVMYGKVGKILHSEVM